MLNLFDDKKQEMSIGEKRFSKPNNTIKIEVFARLMMLFCCVSVYTVPVVGKVPSSTVGERDEIFNVVKHSDGYLIFLTKKRNHTTLSSTPMVEGVKREEETRHSHSKCI